MPMSPIFRNSPLKIGESWTGDRWLDNHAPKSVVSERRRTCAIPCPVAEWWWHRRIRYHWLSTAKPSGVEVHPPKKNNDESSNGPPWTYLDILYDKQLKHTKKLFFTQGSYKVDTWGNNNVKHRIKWQLSLAFWLWFTCFFGWGKLVEAGDFRSPFIWLWIQTLAP